MLLPVTALYAGLSILVALWLAMRVGMARVKSEISLGAGEDIRLLETMRGHGNFTEYVPHAIVLLAIIELNGANHTLLHVLGVVLIASRIAHPLGLEVANMRNPLRAAGMGGTMTVMLVSGVVALWQFFS